ncbi:DeoR/GlpR family DNA-binding transcription regulator [Streptomyces sp. NPDC057301]|uniref:DeoR/GlpR family DNA-binding transcription regulator n=1 Tax=Streptomyces sp. NPDC057301 TaxID=3346093 RepID=UPI003645A814
MADRRRDARISMTLGLLTRRGEVRVRLLPAVLRVSEATVRRDLALMEERGLIRRSYGKITAVRPGAELPVGLRRSHHVEAKRRIGALASALIPRRPLTVALGGGSTVGFVARSLAGRTGLTVVTNGLETAVSLMTRQLVEVVLTGGTARPLSDDLVGTAAVKTLRSYRFDYAVVGADGISADAGLTRFSPHAAEIDRVMLERAEHVIVVADSSKFGRVRKAAIAGLDAVDIVVTDSLVAPETVAALRGRGVRTTVVRVPPD